MNAAVIGCGNIGGFYDTPSFDAILTHAHAFLDSNKTSLFRSPRLRSKGFSRGPKTGQESKTDLEVPELISYSSIP